MPTLTPEQKTAKKELTERKKVLSKAIKADTKELAKVEKQLEKLS